MWPSRVDDRWLGLGLGSLLGLGLSGLSGLSGGGGDCERLPPLLEQTLLLLSCQVFLVQLSKELAALLGACRQQR